LDSTIIERQVRQSETPRAALSGAKRSLDLVLGSVLLVFTAPLLAAAALAVVLDSEGPAFVVQRRTGLAGRTIKVITFRTRAVSKNGSPMEQAERNARRLTRVGRILRRTSIDALPQLINVLRGDMSLVGPRPHAADHDRYFGAVVPGYALRFRVKPGMTGLAQVQGLRGELQTAGCMAERVAVDNAYIDHWSLVLDLNILAKTAMVAAVQPQAY
jgi:lipopolysaccharide/colanic/teichoic acid biosynthesis glycosyltransferase